MGIGWEGLCKSQAFLLLLFCTENMSISKTFSKTVMPCLCKDFIKNYILSRVPCWGFLPRERYRNTAAMLCDYK